MSIYNHLREHRFCPNCEEKLTQRPAKPSREQRFGYIEPETFAALTVQAPYSRNRKVVDEEGYCPDCGYPPDDLPRRIEGPQDVSISDLITRCRRLCGPGEKTEAACDYIVQQKHRASPPPDESILGRAIEDIVVPSRKKHKVETEAGRTVELPIE